MSATIDRVTAIYRVSDLFGIDGIPHYYCGTYEPITEFAVLRAFDGRFGVSQWTASGWDRPCRVTATFAAEPTAAEVRELLRAEYRGSIADAARAREPGRRPVTPAEPVALRFKARLRLTPAELLADPAFRAIARKAAEKGKQFAAELLEWERKDIVREAVARVRAEVDRERAAAKRASDAAARVAAEKADRERPTREAVHAAYVKCGYRQCTQGHDTRVVIGDRGPLGERVGCAAHKTRGEQYSSRCTYRKQASEHRLYVRADWLDAVGAKCATLDVSASERRLVLHACPYGLSERGEVVYLLTTAKQSRGTEIVSDAHCAVWRGDGWHVVPGRQIEWACPPAPRAIIEAHPEVDAREALKMARHSPAWGLADWLEERDVPAEDLRPLRTELAPA